MLTTSARVPNLPSKKDKDESRQRQRRLLSVLTDRDALRLFELASKGVISSKSTPQKLKIPKAQFYRVVAKLCKLELMAKDYSVKEGAYRITPIGEIFYQGQVVTINCIALYNNIMDFLSKFTAKNKSKNEMLRSALKKITQELIEKSDAGLANLRQLKLLETAEEYDGAVQSLISGAKKEIYLVTSRLDLRTISTLLLAAKSGVKTNMLYSDWRLPPNNAFDDTLGDLLSPATMKYSAASDMLAAHACGSLGRISTPYSFVVSDNFRIAIEIPDTEDRESFLAGFGIESEELAKKLVSCYSQLEKENGQKEIQNQVAPAETTPS
jgi:sugar-specific transcriptional regulator TrmB